MNNEYIEDKIEEFWSCDDDAKEQIIKELQENGFISEAQELQQQYDEDRELRNAEDNGSEDGVDLLQDKE